MTPSRRDPKKNAGELPVAVPVLSAGDAFASVDRHVWALRDSRLEPLDQRALKSGDWKPAGLIVIAIEEGNSLPVEQIASFAADEMAPPVVVYGPHPAAAWRERALHAGAFLCFSSKTPIEDQHTMLAAAICYGAVRAENRVLRAESEKISGGLLRAYGEAIEKVRHASDEAWGIQSALQDVQQRILKVLS